MSADKFESIVLCPVEAIAYICMYMQFFYSLP